MQSIFEGFCLTWIGDFNGRINKDLQYATRILPDNKWKEHGVPDIIDCVFL